MASREIRFPAERQAPTSVVNSIRDNDEGNAPHFKPVTHRRKYLITWNYHVKNQQSISGKMGALALTALPAKRSSSRYSGLLISTVKYLLRTEVHTFAFSVAANAILSFFPFVLLLMTLVRRVFHSRVMA